MAISSHSPTAAVPAAIAICPAAADRIDRLGELLQRARLQKRRQLRLASRAIATGDVPGVQAALARFRRARRWETALYGAYVRAVFAVYA